MADEQQGFVRPRRALVCPSAKNVIEIGSQKVNNAIERRDIFSGCSSFRRLTRFTIVSGIGWMTDIFLTLGLVTVGMAIALSNTIGASVAVTFVYFAAQRRVFKVSSVRMSPKKSFAVYVIYQILAVLSASLLIGGLAAFLQLAFPQWNRTSVAAISKITVTPLTLYANFLFTGWLIEGRLSWR